MTTEEFNELPSGVRMIVEQGNLDHWFNAALWGGKNPVRPAPAAFVRAEEAGLVEKHFHTHKWRLTNLGRSMRHQSESAQ